MKNRTEIEELAKEWFPANSTEFFETKRGVWEHGYSQGQLTMREDLASLIEWLQHHPHVLEKSAEEIIERFYSL